MSSQSFSDPNQTNESSVISPTTKYREAHVNERADISDDQTARLAESEGEINQISQDLGESLNSAEAPHQSEISEVRFEDDEDWVLDTESLFDPPRRESLPDTQFKGLIELMKAKESELSESAHTSVQRFELLQRRLEGEESSSEREKLFKESYRELQELSVSLKGREESLAFSMQIAREGLETQRREIEQQQRYLKAQQSAILRSMQSRERLIATEADRVKDQKRLLDQQRAQSQDEIQSQLRDYERELKLKHQQEFNIRCAEAEADFEARHQRLEDRYKEKLNTLNEQRSSLDSFVRHKLTEAQEKLRNNLEEQRGALNLNLEVERATLESRKSELEYLFTVRFEELQAERDAFQIERDETETERAELIQLRADLTQRSQQLKESSAQFREMLEGAKRDRELQSSLREEVERHQEELNRRERALDTRDERFAQLANEIDTRRDALKQQEQEIDELKQEMLKDVKSVRDRAQDELKEAQESRERAIKLEEESERRASILKQQSTSVHERETLVAELKAEIEKREAELNQSLAELERRREESARAQRESEALREDAQRLHEMRSRELEATERSRDEAQRDLELAQEKLKAAHETEVQLKRSLRESKEAKTLHEEQRALLEQERQELDIEYKDALKAVEQQRLMMDEMRSHLDERERRISQREQQVEARDTASQARSDELEQKTEQLESLTQEIEERDQGSREREIEAAQLHQKLERRFAKLNRQREEVKELVEEVKRERSAIEMDSAALEIEKVGLSGLSERARELDERAQQIEQRRAELIDQRRELEREDQRLREIGAKSEAELEHAQELVREVAKREELLEADRAQFEESNEELKSLRDQLQQERRDLEVDQALFATERTELEGFKEQIEVDRLAMDELQQEIDAAHELNLKLIEERARLEEGQKHIKSLEEALERREVLLTQKEEGMWQIESEVSENLEEAKEREAWVQQKLRDIESREQSFRRESEESELAFLALKDRCDIAVQNEERMRSQLLGVEATMEMLQAELDQARERSDRVGDAGREHLKRITQLEMELKGALLSSRRSQQELTSLKESMTLQSDLEEKLKRANQSELRAQDLLREAESERDQLREQRVSIEELQRELTQERRALERSRLKLEETESEAQEAIQEALIAAREQRELAEVERRAAEVERQAALADRQVAQRERITSNHQVIRVEEELSRSHEVKEQPQASEQKPMSERVQPANTSQSTSPERLASAPSGRPRRGPRDARGGAKQVARFGALEIPLRRCPEGIGKIGSEGQSGRPEERPVHQVKFSKAFWLSEAPISQLQWMAVMRQNPSQYTDPDRPVDGVSWIDAARFCNKLSTAYRFKPAYEIAEGSEHPMVYWREDADGFRLPTEAEWEYAARANSSTNNRLYTGDDLNQVGWYRDNAGGETRPIGLKAPNDWGFVDLCGNVWEWCHDEWTRSAYAERSNQPSDGGSAELYEASTGRGVLAWDPAVYRHDLRHKVARGGSFADNAHNCRIACRGRLEVFGRRYSVGLRVCLPHDVKL